MNHPSSLRQRIEQSASVLQKAFATPPRVGLVLGSGLGAFGDTLDQQVKIPFHDVPFMPGAKVVGHAGNFCLGVHEGVPVVCMQGRVHFYEGHPMEAVVQGVRAMAFLGVRCVLLTNAAGGLEPSWSPGDLMMITDHLNLVGENPLVGPNDESLGPRFPDMTAAYDPRLQTALRTASTETQVALRSGVYAWLRGPTYETPAEIRMVRVLGAQAVGMSTVPEVVALRHLGVPVGALSCITNLAAGIAGKPLDHKEVEETAQASRPKFLSLLGAWIREADRVVGASSPTLSEGPSQGEPSP